jgi:hypothetical protein
MSLPLERMNLVLVARGVGATTLVAGVNAAHRVRRSDPAAAHREQATV